MEEASLGLASASANGRHELLFERDLPFTPEDIWTTVSSAERIGLWLAEADVERRPKGHFRLRGQCNVNGVVLEAIPPAVLRWTWPHPDHPHSVVKITIAKLDDAASRLTLTQTDLPKRHLLDVAAGWHTHLDALPRAIAGKRTPFDTERAAEHHQRHATAFRA